MEFDDIVSGDDFSSGESPLMDSFLNSRGEVVHSFRVSITEKPGNHSPEYPHRGYPASRQDWVERIVDVMLDFNTHYGCRVSIDIDPLEETPTNIKFEEGE